MEPFIVEAYVYGWPLPSDSFPAGGIEFTRVRPPWYLRDYYNPRIHHIATGRAKILVAAPHWHSAITAAFDGVFRAASHLLIFAEGTQVFFSHLECESSSHVFQYKGEMRHSWPTPRATRIRKEKQIAFLSRGLDFFSAQGGAERWRLSEALLWFNEPYFAPSTLPHVGYTMLWIALDTLVTAAEEAAESQLFSKGELDVVRRHLEKWTAKKRYSNEQREALVRAISRANEKTAAERVMTFLENLGVKRSRDEIRELVRVRNMIQHAGFNRIENLPDAYPRLQRIAEEAILNVMGLPPDEFLVRDAQRLSFPYFAFPGGP